MALVVKNSPANAGDAGSVSESGRSPGGGNGNPLQYSCLENPMDRGGWQALVHGVARVGHDLATKPPKLIGNIDKIILKVTFISGSLSQQLGLGFTSVKRTQILLFDLVPLAGRIIVLPNMSTS